MSRNEILSSLRHTLARPDLRFPPADPPPLTRDERITVTHAEGNAWELALRFGAELEKLHGTYDVLETPAEARLALIARLQSWIDEEAAERKGAPLITGQERTVLGWAPDQLPIADLDRVLDDLDLILVHPDDLHALDSRNEVRHIRLGLTGVEAAFASTGSMMMASRGPRSRSASLLPLRHVALIPFRQLYPTIESWLANQRDRVDGDSLADLVRGTANLSMITGPSKSADIEGKLTLGVHGPRFVHVILFDDEA